MRYYPSPHKTMAPSPTPLATGPGLALRQLPRRFTGKFVWYLSRCWLIGIVTAAATVSVATAAPAPSPAADPTRPTATAVPGGAPGGSSRNGPGILDPVVRKQYAQLGGSRAISMVMNGNRPVYGLGFNSPSSLIAATQAATTCGIQTIRLQIAAPCEVIRLDDVPITTAAALRGPALPTHPIFAWRVTRNGKTLWLVGSLHVLKATLYPLPTPIMDAWAASDKLIVEVDPRTLTSPATLKLIQQKTSLRKPVPLKKLLPKASYARLVQRSAVANITEKMATRIQPSWLGTVLALGTLASMGYIQELGLEQTFVSFAATTGRPVIPLETVAGQLDAIVGQPLDLQIAMLAGTLTDMSDQEAQVRTMVTAWWRGDTAAFIELLPGPEDQQAAVRKYNEVFLDQRNQGMAKRLGALLDDDPVEFVLVGAAHMGGNLGLVQLLRAAGATVEQLRSDSVIATAGTAQTIAP